MITFDPQAGPISATATFTGADIAGQFAYSISDNRTGESLTSKGGIDLQPQGIVFSMLEPVEKNNQVVVEVVLDFTGMDASENGKKVKVSVDFQQSGASIGTMKSEPVTVDGTGQVARAVELFKTQPNQTA